MLISHRHRFIFFKTRKTGSTTIEMVLGRYMGPLDIITPGPWTDEKIRAKHGHAARNWKDVLHPVDIEKLAAARTEEEADALMKEETIVPVFHEHISAPEIRERVAPVVWEQYQKIVSVRHPYEMALSLAYYHREKNMREKHGKEWDGKSSIHDILNQLDALLKFNTKWMDNSRIYTIDGRMMADHVIRQEHLEEDLRSVMASLGLPADAEIPVVKVMPRINLTPARELLKPQQKAKIAELAAREFEFFGYEK